MALQLPLQMVDRSVRLSYQDRRGRKDELKRWAALLLFYFSLASSTPWRTCTFLADPRHQSHHTSRHMAPNSPAGRRSPSDSDILCARLRALEKNGVGFLPVGEFDDFLSKPAITKVLRNKNFSDAIITELINRIYSPDRPAKLLYLIFLRRGDYESLRALIGSGISDIHLPLALEKDEHGIETFPDFEDFFSEWDDYRLGTFVREQKDFLAPVLSKDEFIYDMRAGIPLPITHRGVTKTSKFSTVTKVTIHPSHLLDLVSILHRLSLQRT